MKRILTAAALAAAFSAGAWAEEDMKGFFPRPQEIAGWTMSYDIDTYAGEKIYDFIDGAGEIFMKYNFEVATAAEYAGPGDASIAVEIYKMKTPEDAYGIWMYQKPTTAEKLEVSQGGYASGITAGVWKGTYYARIYGLEEKEGVAAAAREFAKSVSGRIPSEGNLPNLFKVFEVDGFQKGTIRFLRSDLALRNLHFVSDENVLDLGEGAEMAFADYVLKKRAFIAFVAVYPSQQAAIAAATKYAKFLGANERAEATWFKQTGKTIVGTWTGLKVGETTDSQDVMFETIKDLIEQVKTYQLNR